MRHENKLARQAYKSAIIECLERIGTIDTSGDVGVTFWGNELTQTLGRQLAKLAATELGEVKLARHQATGVAEVALSTVTAERDALAARLLALGRGERATVREARQEAAEAWSRLSVVPGRCAWCGGSGWVDDGADGQIPCVECDRPEIQEVTVG